ncbi:Uncharacterised protein [Vibrio cholerae]|nr:Uncharacterised protein [Vibrio cholerae]
MLNGNRNTAWIRTHFRFMRSLIKQHLVWSEIVKTV